MDKQYQVSIVPTLAVKNGAAAIEFYKKAFGAMELTRMTGEKGDIVAEMAIGTARIVVADESPEHNHFGPESLGGTPVRIGLMVSDPDTLAAQAIAAGAKEIYPVADQDYGYRLGHIVDPFGHHWEIFTPLH